jgi:anti-sigma B factor antagonist
VTEQMFDITNRKLDIAGQPSKLLVEVSGEVDVTNATRFTRTIRGLAGSRPLVLDLTRLNYIDSAGFAALDRLLRQHAITIVLEPHSPIRAAAMLVELPCHDTVADAVRANRSAGD